MEWGVIRDWYDKQWWSREARRHENESEGDVNINEVDNKESIIRKSEEKVEHQALMIKFKKNAVSIIVIAKIIRLHKLKKIVTISCVELKKFMSPIFFVLWKFEIVGHIGFIEILEVRYSNIELQKFVKMITIKKGL